MPPAQGRQGYYGSVILMVNLSVYHYLFRFVWFCHRRRAVRFTFAVGGLVVDGLVVDHLPLYVPENPICAGKPPAMFGPRDMQSSSKV